MWRSQRGDALPVALGVLGWWVNQGTLLLWGSAIPTWKPPAIGVLLGPASTQHSTRTLTRCGTLTFACKLPATPACIRACEENERRVEEREEKREGRAKRGEERRGSEGAQEQARGVTVDVRSCRPYNLIALMLPLISSAAKWEHCAVSAGTTGAAAAG